MGLRFNPSNTTEMANALSGVQSLALDQWKDQQKQEDSIKQLQIMQKMGLIDGMPSDATTPAVVAQPQAGLGGLTGTATPPPMPANAAMSMASGGVGDVEGKPAYQGDVNPTLKAPLLAPPTAKKVAPFVAIPKVGGGFSFAKNPAFNNKQSSTLSGIDIGQIPIPKDADERKQIIDSLPAEVGDVVKQVGTYRMDINKLTSLRAGSEDRLKLDALVSRLYPDMVGEKGFDYTEYGNRNNFQKSFFDPNRPTGIAINAIKQVTYHLGDLHDNVSALATSGSPLLNHPLNWWEKNAAGDPQISSVLTDITAVSEELTKAWAGNNNGEMRVREWKSSLSAANSPDQWKSVMSTAASLLEGATKTRQSQYKATMKREIDILDPDQKSILDTLKGAYKPAGKAQITTTQTMYGQDELLAEAKRRGLVK